LVRPDELTKELYGSQKIDQAKTLLASDMFVPIPLNKQEL
jgi:hypothetical protein